MPKETITTRRAAIIYLSLSVMLTFYHMETIQRHFWIQRSEFHQGIISGTFKSPYQYRVFAPALAEAGGWLIDKGLGLSSIKGRAVSREAIYSLERLTATWALLVFFHLYLTNWMTSELAFAGALLLGGLHTFTYLNYFYQPSSPLEILFLTIAAYRILRGEAGGWLYPLTILGTLTRETFGLIVPLHLCQFGLRKRSLKHTLGLFLTWLVVQVFLHIAFGLRPSFPERAFSINLQEIAWPVCLFALFGIVPLVRFPRLPIFLRRAIVLFAPPLIVANFVFGKVEETRLFLPLSLVLIPATLIGVFQSEARLVSLGDRDEAWTWKTIQPAEASAFLLRREAGREEPAASAGAR